MIQQLRKRMKRVSALQIVRRSRVGARAGRSCRARLQALHRALQKICAASGNRKAKRKSLAEFVEYLDLYEQAGGQINLEEETGQDAVQLMTVHAAKGLEFDHVFILQSDAGKFSQARSAQPMLEFPDELMKEERPRGDFHVQEERRLFYVALTRARARLTLTAIVDNKRNKPSTISGRRAGRSSDRAARYRAARSEGSRGAKGRGGWRRGG